MTASVREKLATLRCDPIEGLARIALDKNTETAIKVRCYAELAEYTHPKLKAIEHSGPGGGPIQHNVSAHETIERELARLAERERETADSQAPQP